MPAAGVLAPLPLQRLGLASHTLLLLDTGEAPALATAVFMQQVIEERNILFFFEVHELIYVQNLKQSTCK